MHIIIWLRLNDCQRSYGPFMNIFVLFLSIYWMDFDQTSWEVLV